MDVVITRDLGEFSARAGMFVNSRPVENNAIASSLAGALAGGLHDGEPLCGWVMESRTQRVLGAVLRLPGGPALASSMSRSAADAVLGALVEADPTISGVSGPEPTASYIASAWRRITGGRVRSVFSGTVFQVTSIARVRKRPEGSMRAAQPDERAVLADWVAACFAETATTGIDARRVVESRLAARELFVWDDGGPRALAARAAPIENVVRVGPLYTPPQSRRRGYGSALLAAVSDEAIIAGALGCTLVSAETAAVNRLYISLGYHPAADGRSYEFAR